MLCEAWEERDASALADVALQLREGERILLRPHRGFSSQQLLQEAVRIAAETKDAAALQRLRKIAETIGSAELKAKVASVEKLAGEARAIDPALQISIGEITPEVYAELWDYLHAIQDASLIGDTTILKELQDDLAANGDIPEKQKKCLLKMVQESEAVAAALPESQKMLGESLDKLSDSSRRGGGGHGGGGHGGGGHGGGHGGYAGGGHGGGHGGFAGRGRVGGGQMGGGGRGRSVASGMGRGRSVASGMGRGRSVASNSGRGRSVASNSGRSPGSTGGKSVGRGRGVAKAGGRAGGTQLAGLGGGKSGNKPGKTGGKGDKGGKGGKGDKGRDRHHHWHWGDGGWVDDGGDDGDYVDGGDYAVGGGDGDYVVGYGGDAGYADGGGAAVVDNSGIGGDLQSAGLWFENHKDQRANVAIVYYDPNSGPTWRVTGWYTVEPGQSVCVLNGDLTNQYYYYYAYCGDSEWEGDNEYYVDPHNAFAYDSQDANAVSNAAQQGFEKHGFNVIDTEGATSYVMQLE